MKPDIVKLIEEDKKERVNTRTEKFKSYRENKDTMEFTDEEFNLFLAYMQNDKPMVKMIKDIYRMHKQIKELKDENLQRYRR